MEVKLWFLGLIFWTLIMSGIPNQEPQAYGLITFRTTFGNIDIELFTKQCPKATQNFVQLCLDDYYRGTVFDRVEKDFIAIGGCSTRGDIDGLNGSFSDEFHSRLKFTRRGLLATANEDKNENGPKFFFTLGATPELQNKHTIFGRAKGNSVYTLVELNECQVDEDYRPYSEQKIEEVIVTDNPFPNLVSRFKTITLGVLDTDSSDEEYYDPLSKPKQDSTTNKKLSFNYGDDDDSDSENEKPDPGQDLADTQDNLKIETNHFERESEPKNLAVSNLESNPNQGPDTKFSAEEKQKRLQEIKAEIQAIKKQIEDSAVKKNLNKRRLEDDSCDYEAKLAPVDREPDLVKAKTTKNRQHETIELVNQFKKKLKQVSKVHQNLQSCRSDQSKSSLEEMDELDKADEEEWLNHKFEPKEDSTEQDSTDRHVRHNRELYRHRSKDRQQERDHNRHSNHRSHHHRDSNTSHKSRRH